MTGDPLTRAQTELINNIMKLTRSRWIKLEGNTEGIGGLPQLKHAFSGKANRMLLDRKDNNPQSGGK